MAIVYFPKEGDKKCSACSYPVSDKGLAFLEPIQKLDMLVNAGFIRKLEIKEFEMKNSTPVDTDKTYVEWVEYLKNPTPKVEEKEKITDVKAEAVITPVILTETPSQIEILEKTEDKVEETVISAVNKPSKPNKASPSKKNSKPNSSEAS